jgi:predicted dehydrogenase
MRRIAALSKRRALKLATGDTTAALIEFVNGATGTLATTLKTPLVWRIAVYGDNAWAESVSETRLVIRRAGAEPETRDCPAANHLRENLEAFAEAALARRPFMIDPAGILQTASALDAVFRSVAADGAWQAV